MENRYVLPSSNMTFTEVGTRERWDIFKVKMDKSHRKTMKDMTPQM